MSSDGKSSRCLWQGELKRVSKHIIILVFQMLNKFESTQERLRLLKSNRTGRCQKTVANATLSSSKEQSTSDKYIILWG